jgi:hypothetical protein
MWKELGIETTDNWYTHKPESVCEHEDITGLWNQEVQTGFAKQAKYNN